MILVALTVRIGQRKHYTIIDEKRVTASAATASTATLQRANYAKGAAK